MAVHDASISRAGIVNPKQQVAPRALAAGS
jgi:hypothetical protein